MSMIKTCGKQYCAVYSTMKWTHTHMRTRIFKLFICLSLCQIPNWNRNGHWLSLQPHFGPPYKLIVILSKHRTAPTEDPRWSLWLSYTQNKPPDCLGKGFRFFFFVSKYNFWLMLALAIFQQQTIEGLRSRQHRHYSLSIILSDQHHHFNSPIISLMLSVVSCVRSLCSLHISSPNKYMC